MTAAEDVIRTTRELTSEGESDSSLAYITQELVDEYERALPANGDDDVIAVREDGSPASAEEIANPEATQTYYGNHYARIGSCLYWKTNGVGQPCGSGFTAKACNWKSVSVTNVQTCSGGVPGYRFVFTF